MKMSRILMVFIIGIISLNLIFADGITKKTFLIKGELEITPQLTTACSGGGTWNNGVVFIIDSENMNGALSSKENDDTLYFSAAASSCDLVIYNTNDIEVYRRSNLNADAIKQGLKNGIPVTLPITSTNPTFNFKVKIYHLSTNSNILETIVTVPNPNAVDTQIEATSSDRLIPQSGIECNSSNLNSVAVVYGDLSVCSAQHEDYVGAPVQYNWASITSGTGTTTSYISTFASLFQKFSYDDFSIDNNYHGTGRQRIILNPQIDVQFNLLNQDVVSLNNRVSLIYNNITDGYELYDDIVDFDNLTTDLKSSVGYADTQTITVSQIPNKYKVITESGITYYIPLYAPSGYAVSAVRRLITNYDIFDPTQERVSGGNYVENYPPIVGNKLYSDFYAATPDRKWFSTIRYKPIDLHLSNGGSLIDYKITVVGCTGNDPDDENPGHSPIGWSGCNTVIPANNLRGDTINDTLTNPFFLRTNEAGEIEDIIHVKIPTGIYGIGVKFQPASGGNEKSSEAAEIKELYAPISNINITNPHTNTECKYTITQDENEKPVYTYRVSAHLVISGGSNAGYYLHNRYGLCLKAHVANYSPSDIPRMLALAGCSPTGNSKNETDVGPYYFTFKSGDPGYNEANPTPQTSVLLFVTLKDYRTNQRFAKALTLTGCVNG